MNRSSVRSKGSSRGPATVTVPTLSRNEDPPRLPNFSGLDSSLHRRDTNYSVLGGFVKKSLLVAAAVALLAGLVLAGSGTAAPVKAHATFTAALVSDIGKFNDKGFNENQLAGLNEAKAKLGVKTISIQSNSSSDYLPNLTTMVRQGANIVSAAGFLLAPTLSQVASQFPSVDF